MQLAYARKYRPRDFDEIVDQDHIALTLKNAIAQNNIAHAYLFSGPRGIGKTSMARILAKALNCVKGPTDKPCHECAACQEISEGRNMDVLEIDGASNRGIDEIRTLRENVKFAPSASRFKIYIIDEVHMLTTEAFNALLKTLEEPPPHVKFIFATTEPHKVLPTILSRCQRFDFRKITTPGIINKLKELIKQEKIKCDEEALYSIARNADGSLRDAEVILDQMNSFSQGKITQESVDAVLGLVSKEAVFAIVDNLNSANVAKNLQLLDKLIQDGKEPAQLAASFVDYFRDMMLIKCDCPDLVSLPKEDREKVALQSKKFGTENILYCLAVLTQTQERIKRQGMSRLLLEMAILKLSEQESVVSAGALIDKIKTLEQKIKNIPLKPEAFVSDNRGSGYEPKHIKETPAAVVPKTDFIKETPKPPKTTKDAPPAAAVKPVNPARDAGPEPAGESYPPVSSGHTAVLEMDKVVRAWPSIVSAVRKQKMSLGMYLAEGRPLSISNNKLEIGFLSEFEFHRENLLESENLKLIENTASNLLRGNIRFALIQCDNLPDAGQNLEEPELEDPGIADPEESEGGEAQDFDSFIQSAMDVFNGRIIQND